MTDLAVETRRSTVDIHLKPEGKQKMAVTGLTVYVDGNILPAASLNNENQVVATAITAVQSSVASLTAVLGTQATEITAAQSAASAASEAATTAESTATSAATAAATAESAATAAQSSATSAQSTANAALTKAEIVDIPFSFIGSPTASMVLLRALMARPISFPAGLSGSPTPVCVVAPTAAVALTLKWISGGTTTTVGTVNWAAGSTTGTFTLTAGFTTAAGDILELDYQATADATFQSLCNFHGDPIRWHSFSCAGSTTRPDSQTC